MRLVVFVASVMVIVLGVTTDIPDWLIITSLVCGIVSSPIVGYIVTRGFLLLLMKVRVLSDSFVAGVFYVNSFVEALLEVVMIILLMVFIETYEIGVFFKVLMGINAGVLVLFMAFNVMGIISVSR